MKPWAKNKLEKGEANLFPVLCGTYVPHDQRKRNQLTPSTCSLTKSGLSKYESTSKSNSITPGLLPDIKVPPSARSKVIKDHKSLQNIYYFIITNILTFLFILTNCFNAIYKCVKKVALRKYERHRIIPVDSILKAAEYKERRFICKTEQQIQRERDSLVVM